MCCFEHLSQMHIIDCHLQGTQNSSFPLILSNFIKIEIITILSFTALLTKFTNTGSSSRTGCSGSWCPPWSTSWCLVCSWCPGLCRTPGPLWTWAARTSSPTACVSACFSRCCSHLRREFDQKKTCLQYNWSDCVGDCAPRHSHHLEREKEASGFR